MIFCQFFVLLWLAPDVSSLKVLCCLLLRHFNFPQDFVSDPIRLNLLDMCLFCNIRLYDCRELPALFVFTAVIKSQTSLLLHASKYTKNLLKRSKKRDAINNKSTRYITQRININFEKYSRITYHETPIKGVE